ncbi:hypothetical protein D6D26_05338 [Aureobasidium pullulans]|nr:hypothetical protein D6D26_05338 [Aureobasidium pullulans]
MSKSNPESLPPAYTDETLREPETLAAADPPQYSRRTASQEAANLKALKAWAERRDMIVPGAYMETFNIGGKKVVNGQLVEQTSTTSHPTTSHHQFPTAAEEKEKLGQQGDNHPAVNSGEAGPSNLDDHSSRGFGRRVSEFLKRISPAERAQQRGMAMNAEEDAADAKKYPMSEGTYGWEDYDPNKSRE